MRADGGADTSLGSGRQQVKFGAWLRQRSVDYEPGATPPHEPADQGSAAREGESEEGESRACGAPLGKLPRNACPPHPPPLPRHLTKSQCDHYILCVRLGSRPATHATRRTRFLAKT